MNNFFKTFIFSIITALTAVSAAIAAPPYTFNSGGTIRASEINANFAYLESLINASGAVIPANLIRVSASVLTNTKHSFFSVPSSALQPYVIRQLNCSASKCILGIGSDEYAFTPLVHTNLLIPVAAGETVFLTPQLSSGVVGLNLTSMIISK